MTTASIRALDGMRDLARLQWYVIPLLAIVFYIYAKEIHKARAGGNWDAVFAGLTLFGMDFINETVNGWIFHFTGYSALWTAPANSAFKVMIGWNIEIIFMFLLAGIVYYYTLSPRQDQRIFGLPEKWFWAIGYAAFCVFVEILLNIGGHLVWEYPFWKRSLGGVWLIFLFGYLHFFVAIIFMLSRPTLKSKMRFVGILYAIAIVMNIFGLGIKGWIY